MKKQKNYNSSGVLSPTLLEPSQAPAILQGPMKSTIGKMAERITPKLITKMASCGSEKRKKVHGLKRETVMKERLYSVTMTETEAKLFSEFLEQREYATKPLTPKAVQAERNRLAKEMWDKRRRFTPEGYSLEFRRDMKKKGYPKHYIDNHMAVRKPGNLYKNPEAVRESRSRLLEEIRDKKDYLDFRIKNNL